MKLKWPQKNPQKQGRFLEGGGEEFFWLARIYTPALHFLSLFEQSRYLHIVFRWTHLVQTHNLFLIMLCPTVSSVNYNLDWLERDMVTGSHGLSRTHPCSSNYHKERLITSDLAFFKLFCTTILNTGYLYNRHIIKSVYSQHS